MKKTFAVIAFTAACMFLAGCEKGNNVNEDDDPGKYLSESRYVITEILYAADATPEDAAAAIEIDMQNSAPFAAGDSHVFTSSQWTVTSPDDVKLFEGTYVWEADETYPEALSLLMPNNQIVTWRKMTLDGDGGKSVYYLFIVKNNLTRANFSSSYYDMWLYEDLTEYFQELYPEAEVDGAVRVQVCKPAAVI